MKNPFTIFQTIFFDGVPMCYLYSFNGFEKDDEVKGSGNQLSFGDYGLDVRLSRRWNIDPKISKFPYLSPFSVFNNSPIFYNDLDGNEPIKPQAGTVSGFIEFFNTTRTKMGTLTGAAAQDAVLRLGQTTMNWNQFRPVPATTAPFNKISDRYIYTEKGGWIDMAHFLFYAGKAYANKLDKEAAMKQLKGAGETMNEHVQNRVVKRASQDPVGEAVQDGYTQECSDKLFAPYSAYSYEDLPSDKLGAEFGSKYFDPKSKLTLGVQVENYMNNVLKATTPQNAPNYECLPATEPTKSPSSINTTTNPQTPVCTD